MNKNQPWTAKVLAMGEDMRAKVRMRLDSWANTLTGVNTGRDKTTGSLPFADIILSPVLLENLFHGDDISARIVSAVPDECFREPWHIINKTSDDETAELV